MEAPGPSLLAITASWGMCCAVIAVVYAAILPAEDTPLRPWYGWLQAWHETTGWRSWIVSPIGGCAKCTAGQLALWSYSVIEPWSWGLSIYSHVLAACWAVLFAIIIIHPIKWIQRQL